MIAGRVRRSQQGHLTIKLLFAAVSSKFRLTHLRNMIATFVEDGVILSNISGIQQRVHSYAIQFRVP